VKTLQSIGNAESRSPSNAVITSLKPESWKLNMPVFGFILIIEDCEGLSWRDVLYLGKCSVWICTSFEAFMIIVRSEVSCLTTESCETFESLRVHEIYIPIDASYSCVA